MSIPTAIKHIPIATRVITLCTGTDDVLSLIGELVPAFHRENLQNNTLTLVRLEDGEHASFTKSDIEAIFGSFLHDPKQDANWSEEILQSLSLNDYSYITEERGVVIVQSNRSLRVCVFEKKPFIQSELDRLLSELRPTGRKLLSRGLLEKPEENAMFVIEERAGRDVLLGIDPSLFPPNIDNTVYKTIYVTLPDGTVVSVTSRADIRSEDMSIV